jgi:hypothetical protein
VCLLNERHQFSNIEGVSNFTDIEERNPPTIKTIIRSIRRMNGVDNTIAIVNSDIQLSKDAVCGCDDLANKHGRIWAATSFRHEDRGYGLVVQDQGLDFFATTEEVWRRIEEDIPDFLTLGRGLWDNWMNGWFRKNLPAHRYYDLTPLRCVIHPTHDREPGRLSAYTEDQAHQVLTHPKIKCGGIPLKKYTKKCGSK